MFHYNIANRIYLEVNLWKFGKSMKKFPQKFLLAVKKDECCKLEKKALTFSNQRHIINA